jgi:hypothetical protein
VAVMASSYRIGGPAATERAGRVWRSYGERAG